MEALYRAEVFIAALCFTAAAIIYGFTPWRKTLAGRGLFVVLANFAIILNLIVTSFWLGDYPGRDLVRTVLYTLTMINGMIAVAFVFAAQIIGARKEITYGRRHDDEPRNPTGGSRKA